VGRADPPPLKPPVRELRRRGLRRAAGFLLTALVALAAIAAVSAVPAAPPERGIATREQTLAAIRAEIVRLQARLAQEKQRRSSVEDELAAADLDLQLQQARLAEAVTARDIAARRAAASEEEVARLEADLAAVRRELGARLGALYRLGRQGYFRLLLALEPRKPLLPSLRLMRYLARRDRQTFDHYRESRARLAAERDRLVAEREEREQWIVRAAARRRELLDVRRRKAALLARLEQERRTLEARANELEERERKLSELLDLLYGRNPAALAGTPIQHFKGVLDWPAPARVTAGFGPRLDPRYHTRVPHNGLDLDTEPGEAVKAVFPGKVVYAAPFEGYGNTVVVHHPGRVFTLYAGLTDLRKSTGDMVSLGDVVGLASSSLYFEIRVENRPDDPLSWLRGSP
jgi:murein hydrolase activator